MNNPKKRSRGIVSPMNKVDLEDAKKEICRYRKLLLKLAPYYPAHVSQTHGCHVRKEDLEAMLAEFADGDGIRCYLGLRKQEGTLDDQYFTCLVMVPTRSIGGIDVDQLDLDSDCKIYEFTTPCPDSCDSNSQFFAPDPKLCEEIG